MTELVLKSGRYALNWVAVKWPANIWRLVVLAVLASIANVSPELRAIVFSSISDAYLQVTVFVAGTLAVVYLFEGAFRFNLGRFMAQARFYQAPIASFLGALPGCGGAIIVITQYTKGYVSFGSVVAVLIATMGDAAFLLIAREPLTGLAIMAIGLVCGTLFGWLVDSIHGQEFMRPAINTSTDNTNRILDKSPNKPGNKLDVLNWPWIAFVVPGVVLGLFVAMQLESDYLFGPISTMKPTHWFGVAGGLLCLIMWTLGQQSNSYVVKGEGSSDVETYTTSNRIIKDTNFVTSWVVLGFLSYELAVYFTGSGIENWFKVYAPFVPLVAVLVGFIPGCGPQIVITTLYLSGVIPLSAQLGNAIANDGDALFPAIALAPRAAILATIYSAVPAFIIGYGYYFLIE